jgi:V/A-type H+-transporting ATPase subunit D
MELLRLRRRLALARRGHKLLKDKLEELMRQFLETLRRFEEVQSEYQPRLHRLLQAWGLTSALHDQEELERLIPQGKLGMHGEIRKSLALPLPVLKIASQETASYDLRLTDSELDVGLKKAQEFIPRLVELARLVKTIDLLAQEIERTRRRVNALEHILIPNLEETIRSIASRLEEMERAFQIQLMRVKEIVRAR